VYVALPITLLPPRLVHHLGGNGAAFREEKKGVVAGITSTNIGPDVAPRGSWWKSSSRSRMITTGIPFSVTWLLPATPKPDPINAHLLPDDPVVAETVAITGTTVKFNRLLETPAM